MKYWLSFIFFISFYFFNFAHQNQCLNDTSEYIYASEKLIIKDIILIGNKQTVDRIINAQERLVGGTGDLSQVGGMVPGTSVVGVTNNVPVRSGGTKTTVPPNVVEPVIQVKKNIKEK